MSILRDWFWFSVLMVCAVAARGQIARDEVEEMEAAEAAERGQI
jgi:hypothetical protein